MIVSCPQCATRFDIPDDKYRPGRMARCSNCGSVFPLPELPGMAETSREQAIRPEPEAPAQTQQAPQPPVPRTASPQFRPEPQSMPQQPAPQPQPVEAFTPPATPQPIPAEAPSNPPIPPAPVTPSATPPRSVPNAAAIDQSFGEQSPDVPHRAEDILGPEDLASIGVQPEPAPLAEPRPAPEHVIPEENGFPSPAFFDDAVLPPAAAPPKKSRKKIFMLLGASIAAILLGVAVYVFISLVGSSPEKPSAKELARQALARRLAIENVQQYTMTDNKSAGTLAVMTGTVVNNFDTPKDLILLEVTIYDKNGKILVVKEQYCGVVLDATRLATLSKSGLSAALSDRREIFANNMNIPPGGSVPFMAVFYDLPNDAYEFEAKIVDVKDSAPQR